MTKIIVASSSKRRMDLLTAFGIDFKAIPANIEEAHAPDETPDQLVVRLATEKAFHISRQFPDEIILGADTIVYFRKKIIGKPKNLHHATQMLEELSGNTHTVYTGVCLTKKASEKTISWHTTTSVTFKKLTPEIVSALVHASNPLDKAGGYALQEHEEILIENYNGLRSNVIGLPIEQVKEKLLEFD